VKKHKWLKDDRDKNFRIGTNQYSILKFIYSFGETGISYSDIVRFILKLDVGASLKDKRGHYATWMSYKLPLWAEKIENGKYILKDKKLKSHFLSETKTIQHDIINRLIKNSNISPKNLTSIISKIYRTI
jgi:hypothetical protein